MSNAIETARKDLFAPVSFGGGGESGGSSGTSNSAAEAGWPSGQGYGFWPSEPTPQSQNLSNGILGGAVTGGVGGAFFGPQNAALGAVSGGVAGGVHAFGQNMNWW